MPLHDWTRVEAGLFHVFHQAWSIRIMDALNGGILGDSYYALVEQKLEGPEPDVIAVHTPTGNDPKQSTAILEPPSATLKARMAADAVHYSKKANRLVIRHHLGEVVSIVEIISPGNKSSRHAFRALLEKTIQFLRAGVHVLLVDLFPPSARDPQGIHGAIWTEIGDSDFELPPGHNRTIVSYQVDDGYNAYIEPLALGAPLPGLPLFLKDGRYVRVPLEETYFETWTKCPGPIRALVEG